MQPNTNISMLITACGRNDLLKATLESFFQNCDIEPQQIVIFEDSDTPKPEWLEDWQWRRRHVEWVSDGERKGQAYAICRLIKLARHDYTLWWEEDWMTQKNSGCFIAESKAILDKHPRILQVSLRGSTGWHPLVKQDENELQIAEPYWRGVWGGLAWNPGLRRTREMKELVLPRIAQQIGKEGLEHEQALSKQFLDEGWRIADLGRAIVTHIGGGRSRSIEKLPPLPRILVAVPTCFQFDYESHSLKNPEGFHVNGPNEQTLAVRETWGYDFQQFKNVDVRYFYGGGNCKGDEVSLPCGDGYDSLIQKTAEICRWAAERDYKFVFKCDTDTWVYAERLLVEIMENHFDYAGYNHANVASGGPGYLLSKRACELIAAEPNPQHEYAEDVHVARVLAKHGIRPLMLPGHRSGMSAHFFFGNPEVFDPTKITDHVVTAHAVFPSQMRAWHEWKKPYAKAECAHRAKVA